MPNWPSRAKTQKTKKQLRQEAIERSKRRDDEDRPEEFVIPENDYYNYRNVLDCIPGKLM